MRRVPAFVVAALAFTLTACQVDTTVHVAVRPDGSGTITLTAVADAEVVEQAPGLAEDLRFDDAIAAGWQLDGPTATSDGGLRVVLTHSFATVEEATALLQSINGSDGPLQRVALTRSVVDGDLTTTLSGSLRVDGGVSAFADPDLLAAIGGSPYADNIAATGLRPTDVVTFTFSADLPGTVVGDATQTTGSVPTGDGELTWSVPLDGTVADLTTTAVLREGEATSSTWATVATVAWVLLVVWCIAAAAFIAFVVVARRRRAQRRAAAASRSL